MTELTPEQAQEKAMKEWELNIRTAERAHDRQTAYALANSKTVVKDAWAVIRNLILINGGAAISILTFAGVLAARANTQPTQLSEIAKGLKFFAAGVVAGTITAALAYLTNYCYGEANSRFLKSFAPPYVRETPFSKRLVNTGRIFHVAALLSVIASLVCFVRASWLSPVLWSKDKGAPPS